jgi:hypothetical protein
VFPRASIAGPVRPASFPAPRRCLFDPILGPFRRGFAVE